HWSPGGVAIAAYRRTVAARPSKWRRAHDDNSDAFRTMERSGLACLSEPGQRGLRVRICNHVDDRRQPRGQRLAERFLHIRRIAHADAEATHVLRYRGEVGVPIDVDLILVAAAPFIGGIDGAPALIQPA